MVSKGLSSHVSEKKYAHFFPWFYRQAAHGMADKIKAKLI